ncbi:U4/U6.U5 small nuclear ribonucleoprotein [Homalodisca vitripennis]|nr:U4/U6.U5 small nuclear ribonucleoprotein [Homalodisca vitripennis]
MEGPLSKNGPIPSNCRLLVKAITAALVVLTLRPIPSHQFPTMFRATLVSSVTVMLNLPLTNITMSSMYPYAKTLLLLKDTSRSSPTRFHRRGEKTPPWGQSLVDFALMLAPIRVNHVVSDADLEGKTQEEQEMMKMLGFCTFDTTRGKKVEGNEDGAVHVILKRKYRQYMNRKGGFNRPLDFVA